MPESAVVEIEPVIESLYSQIVDLVQKTGNNVDKSQIINQLLDRLGFMPARRKRTQAPKLEMPDNIKDSIKAIEDKLILDIAAVNGEKVITTRKKKAPTKIDKSEARYMIETALLVIGQQRGDKRFTKKNIDTLLGYNEKTMYNQRDLCETNIKTEGTIEYKLFTEVRGELERLTAQI